MELRWTAPEDNGGSPVTGYQHRVLEPDGGVHTDWTDIPDGPDPDVSASDERRYTVTGLANGSEYTFEVRAVNGSTPGEGPAAQVQATPSAAGGSRGVTVSPTALTVTKGTSRTYTAKLNTQPTESVTVTPSSSNTKVTFSPASLTFTTTNWNTAPDGDGDGGAGCCRRGERHHQPRRRGRGTMGRCRRRVSR